MKGLLLKDYYSIVKYGKTTLVIVILFSVFALTTGNIAFLSAYIPIFFTNLIVSTFSYDDKTKWDNYALSLPLGRKGMVFSKYVMALFLSLVGTGISILIILAYHRFHTNIDLMGSLISCGAIFCLCLTVIAILFPFIYKFGVEKSRMILIAVYAVPVVAILLLEKSGLQLPSEEQVLTILKLIPVMVIFLYGGSYLLSNRIFLKKEL